MYVSECVRGPVSVRIDWGGGLGLKTMMEYYKMRKEISIFDFGGVVRCRFGLAFPPLLIHGPHFFRVRLMLAKKTGSCRIRSWLVSWRKSAGRTGMCGALSALCYGVSTRYLRSD